MPTSSARPAPPPEPPPGQPSPFEEAPFLVIWETTRSCDLACKHCRAEACPIREPDELSTFEAKKMLDEVREFGPIVFVFSGGDCLKRPDIFELTAHAANLGLRVAATPAATPLADRERLERFRDAGLARLAVSIDSASDAIHDDFRGVPGAWDQAVRVLEEARDAGLSTQINTVVAHHNFDDLEAMAALAERLGIVFWEVFFLVPVGRARPEDVVGADAFERTLRWLHRRGETLPFDVKATAAPHCHRVAWQEAAKADRAARRAGSPPGAVSATQMPGARRSRHAGRVQRDGIGRARGVNDGDGFVFVGRKGEIQPSGFLPITVGNVRRDGLARTYREAPLMRALRDRDRLKGKCAVCAFRGICGGSRARAWAMTGDPTESEPCCAYVPPRYKEAVARGDAEPVASYFARRLARLQA
ncbi:MAG: TIGR04053 family radical SAM/SPASM domain-containing protein [Gemmatimonadota bacterium]